MDAAAPARHGAGPRGIRPLPDEQSVLYFIHIPKTAGTTFRETALARFGPKRAVFIYGRGHKNTSTIVDRRIYGYDPAQTTFDDAILDVARTLETDGAQVFGGHALHRVLSALDPERCVVFLRDPVERYLSHYDHVRQRKEKCSFEEFLENDQYTNLQSRYLSGARLERLGGLALTEDYTASIKLLNARFGLALPVETARNTTHFWRKSPRNRLRAAHEAAILERNADDIALYARAKALFAKRAAAGITP